MGHVHSGSVEASPQNFSSAMFETLGTAATESSPTQTTRPAQTLMEGANSHKNHNSQRLETQNRRRRAASPQQQKCGGDI